MRKSVAFGLALALAGCSLGTGYQPMGLTGGYSEQQLSLDTYKIHVLANGWTDTRRAQEIAMLRASELTLNAGYNRFASLSADITERGIFGQPLPPGKILVNLYGVKQSMPSGDLTIQFVKPGDPAYDKAIDAVRLAPLLKQELGVTPPEAHSTAPSATNPQVDAVPHS
jgi:hypothetical protein